MSGCGTVPGQVWRYEAALGLVDTPTLDGRLLLTPQKGEAGQWVRAYPLPVLGYERASRPGDGQGTERDMPQPVGTIDAVLVRGSELVAQGRFGDTVLGRHYAGALSLDAVQLAVDLDETRVEGEMDFVHADGEHQAVTRFTRWRIMGCHLVKDSAWDRALLSAPRVWQVTEPVW